MAVNKKALIAVGLVVVAGGGFTFTKMKSSKPAVSIGRVVTAETGDVALIVSESGTLEPVIKVDVKSRVAGRLSRFFVKPGDVVGAGQLLAIVDPKEVAREVAGIAAQVRSARAGLEQTKENEGLISRQVAIAVERARIGVQTAESQVADAEVSKADAAVNLRDAELGVETAEKRLAQTAAPTRPQELAQAVASLKRAEDQLEDQKRLVERRKTLLTKGFISQQDVDTAETQVRLQESDILSARQRVALLKEGPRKEDIDTAKLAVDAAKIRVEQANVRLKQADIRVAQAKISLRNSKVELQNQQNNLGTVALRKRDIERSRADVAQIENRFAQQSVQLTETRIVAPMAGEVTGKYLEEGELVASATAGFAQGAAIVTIANLKQMQVRTNVNEVDVVKVKVGQPVEIRVDGVRDVTFHGVVASKAPASLASSQAGTTNTAASATSNQVVRFEVKVRVTDGDARLRPGMTASVDILLDRKSKVTRIPTEAIRRDDTVMIMTGTKEKPVLTSRKVTLGLRSDSVTEVISGMKPGEKVEVPKIDAKDRRKVNFQDGPGD
ncbi:MAG: HlyD family efflux transporter periplasmic adaptor subunit [Armatimonadota bacterium]